MESYRSALILGYGRSGRAAEKMLQAEGCETRIFSKETTSEEGLRNELDAQSFDVCIVSPGFALIHPWMSAIREKGILLLSELELGWSRHKGRTIAVTGSNGKSTAVKWICEGLQLAGEKAAIGGNYGIPASEVVLDHPDLDWLVLEVSSFQLETVQHFQADVAVILNVLPNHLDRHGSMEEYRRMKSRILGTCDSICIVPEDLKEQLQHDIKGNQQWITFGEAEKADYHFDAGAVFKDSAPVLNLKETAFDSEIIGGCTGAAVAAVATACTISLEAFEVAARQFKPLPHRMQEVGVIEGVRYINDSKATNLAAMAAALQATGKSIHLIAGGLPKESEYTFVKEILAERVRSIYVIGNASQAMYKAWNGVCPCLICETLDVAFQSAQNTAVTGDTILLSPGCASFDQFCSFEERGERFIALFQESVQAV